MRTLSILCLFLILSLYTFKAQENYLSTTITEPLTFDLLQPMSVENSSYLTKLAELRHINIHGEWETLNTATFSADGYWLATATNDGLRVWDVVTGEIILNLPDQKYVLVVAFSPDKRNLAVYSHHRDIEIIDLELKKVKDLAWDGVVWDLEYPPDNPGLLVVGFFGAELIDTTSGEVLETLVRTDGSISYTDGAFSSRGSYIALNGSRLWRVGTIEPIFPLGTNPVYSSRIAFSEDEAFLAEVGNGGAVLWELNNRSDDKEFAIIKHTLGNESSLAFIPDNTVAIFDIDESLLKPRNVWLWRPQSERYLRHILSFPPSRYRDMDLNHQANLLATSSEEGIIDLYGIPRCAIRATQNANLRAGASIESDVLGSLQIGWVLFVTRQEFDEEGNIWWQLTNQRWIRNDNVELLGTSCAEMPYGN